MLGLGGEVRLYPSWRLGARAFSDFFIASASTESRGEGGRGGGVLGTLVRKVAEGAGYKVG